MFKRGQAIITVQNSWEGGLGNLRGTASWDGKNDQGPEGGNGVRWCGWGNGVRGRATYYTKAYFLSNYGEKRQANPARAYVRRTNKRREGGLTGERHCLSSTPAPIGASGHERGNLGILTKLDKRTQQKEKDIKNCRFGKSAFSLGQIQAPPPFTKEKCLDKGGNAKGTIPKRIALEDVQNRRRSRYQGKE